MTRSIRRPGEAVLPLVVAGLLLSWACPATADEMSVTMHKATQQGLGDAIGTITMSSSDAGTSFKLNLHGLPPGLHGFHVHQNPSCDPTLLNTVRIPAGAAGSPWDPENTGKHAGPTGDGYLGDLPVLEVANDGTASQTLTAPRIKDVALLQGHSLIIHMGGDNYSDQPVRLGGGGSRIACGVIPAKAS